MLVALMGMFMTSGLNAWIWGQNQDSTKSTLEVKVLVSTYSKSDLKAQKADVKSKRKGVTKGSDAYKRFTDDISKIDIAIRTKISGGTGSTPSSPTKSGKGRMTLNR